MANSTSIPTYQEWRRRSEAHLALRGWRPVDSIWIYGIWNDQKQIGFNVKVTDDTVRAVTAVPLQENAIEWARLENWAIWILMENLSSIEGLTHKNVYP